MSPPEGGPGLIPFAEAENKELRWPEEGPGAVGEVAVSTIISMQSRRTVDWCCGLRTYSMQYALFQCRLCWIYTAVSVCTAKATRLTNRNPAAYVYRLLVAALTISSGSRS